MTSALLEIETQCDVPAESPVVAQLCTAAETTFAHVLSQEQTRLKPVTETGTLSLVLTDDVAMRALNQTYRGIDKTTDVLSFEDGTSPAPDLPIYWGDLIISVEQAQRQADQGGHMLVAELTLLTVHGCLHLLGYDHATVAEQAEMWRVQAAVLTTLNNPITTPIDSAIP